MTAFATDADAAKFGASPSLHNLRSASHDVQRAKHPPRPVPRIANKGGLSAPEPPAADHYQSLAIFGRVPVAGILLRTRRSIASDAESKREVIRDNSRRSYAQDRLDSMRTRLHVLVAVAALTAVGGCEEIMSVLSQGPHNDAAQTQSRWEKVCTRTYFYNPSTRGEGTTYCGHWEHRCVDNKGQRRTNCGPRPTTH